MRVIDEKFLPHRDRIDIPSLISIVSKTYIQRCAISIYISYYLSTYYQTDLYLIELSNINYITLFLYII
jgi:hypothetical protein